MIQNVIDGFKSLLGDFFPVDAGEFEADLRPSGAVAIAISNLTPVQTNVPDWILTVDFMGLTTADADPDKRLVNALFDGVSAALAGLTIAEIAEATGEKASLFIPFSAVAPSGESGRQFNIQYQLFVQDFNQKGE